MRETAINILTKYLQNIDSNPSEEKFKKIKKSNKAFTNKVASQKSGVRSNRTGFSNQQKMLVKPVRPP